MGVVVGCNMADPGTWSVSTALNVGMGSSCYCGKKGNCPLEGAPLLSHGEWTISSLHADSSLHLQIIGPHQLVYWFFTLISPPHANITLNYPTPPPPQSTCPSDVSGPSLCGFHLFWGRYLLNRKLIADALVHLPVGHVSTLEKVHP